jgi:hypothetical protein
MDFKEIGFDNKNRLKSCVQLPFLVLPVLTFQVLLPMS